MSGDLDGSFAKNEQKPGCEELSVHQVRSSIVQRDQQNQGRTNLVLSVLFLSIHERHSGDVYWESTESGACKDGAEARGGWTRLLPDASTRRVGVSRFRTPRGYKIRVLPGVSVFLPAPFVYRRSG